MNPHDACGEINNSITKLKEEYVLRRKVLIMLRNKIAIQKQLKNSEQAEAYEGFLQPAIFRVQEIHAQIEVCAEMLKKLKNNLYKGYKA